MTNQNYQIATKMYIQLQQVMYALSKDNLTNTLNTIVLQLLVFNLSNSTVNLIYYNKHI